MSQHSIDLTVFVIVPTQVVVTGYFDGSASFMNVLLMSSQPISFKRYGMLLSVGASVERAMRIGAVFTPPSARGRGLAPALLRAAMAEAAELGYAAAARTPPRSAPRPSASSTASAPTSSAKSRRTRACRGTSRPRSSATSTPWRACTRPPPSPPPRQRPASPAPPSRSRSPRSAARSWGRTQETGSHHRVLDHAHPPDVRLDRLELRPRPRDGLALARGPHAAGRTVEPLVPGVPRVARLAVSDLHAVLDARPCDDAGDRDDADMSVISSYTVSWSR